MGYGIGPTELMSYFARMRTTFSVSTPAQAAALAALEDEAHMQKALVNNAEQAARLTESLPKWDMEWCQPGRTSSIANWARMLRPCPNAYKPRVSSFAHSVHGERRLRFASPLGLRIRMQYS